jgi:hypothetical protein
MRDLHLLGCASIAAFSLMACRSNELPDDFVGGYTQTRGAGMNAEMNMGATGAPEPASVFGKMGFSSTAELTVTKGGMSARGGAFGPTQIHIGTGGVGMDDATADLFSTVDCSGARCTFKTKGGCEGTVERTNKNELAIVASGGCSSWSGTWTPK